MNVLELPPSHVRIAYTVSELREIRQSGAATTTTPGHHDRNVTFSDYEFVVAPIFPIASVRPETAFVFFCGVRYDGDRRDGVRPLFLLDFWHNDMRLCPGVFDAEVLRSDAKLSEPDGWIRFDGGCSPASGNDPTSGNAGVPALKVLVGIRKDIPDPTKTEFSLRLCFKEIQTFPRSKCPPL